MMAITLLLLYNNIWVLLFSHSLSDLGYFDFLKPNENDAIMFTSDIWEITKLFF